LISFINEAVYGVDATITFCNFCVLLLKFKIPESYKYYRRFFAKNIFKYSANLPWKHHLKFFFQNPSKEEVRHHFSIPSDINDWVKPRELHYEFYEAILELFYDEFTDENIFDLYDACDTCSVSLKAFSRRYFSIIDEDELMRAYNSDTSYINRSIICTELSVRFGKTIDTCYFSTRNSLNELSLDRVASFDSKAIFKQLKKHPNSRIYDFELIVTVMNSDLITPKLRLHVLQYYIYGYNYDVFELLVKETIQPINFIEYCDCYIDIPFTIFSYPYQYPLKIVLEFVDSVDDPLIYLVILDSKFPPEANHIIQRKILNLNKVYRIDLKLGYKLCQFVGRTMHFKQILKELNDPELNEAFNLDSDDINHDYSTIDESLPVVIVDEYYTFTLNSH
jgi:hypothetical protein